MNSYEMFQNYLIHYVGPKTAHDPTHPLPHSTFRVIGYQIYYVCKWTCACNVRIYMVCKIILQIYLTTKQFKIAIQVIKNFN